MLAFLPKGLPEKLGLPEDHNQRLGKRDLRNYRLQGLHLSEANFSGFDLRGADLRDAILDRADLRSAGLIDAIGLTMEQLQQTIIDENTKAVIPEKIKLPDEFPRFQKLRWEGLVYQEEKKPE